MKRPDFQLDRNRDAQPSLSIDPGPPLSSLLRGKAIGGPLAGAKIEGPQHWDGKVWAKTGQGQKLHPGNYKYDLHNGTWAWVWKENGKTPSKERAIR